MNILRNYTATCCGLIVFLFLFFSISIVSHAAENDWRNIRNGHTIPDQGYCDQPYIVITQDGNWLCTLTTGKGKEGDPGQHVVAAISEDQGKTWSELIDIEPETGPEASWAVPFITPYGRIYAFYDYNGDRITGRRADMLGWYVYKYSDDNGRTWSDRYRLPVRRTACDKDNGLPGDTQIFWGIDKPMAHDGIMYFAFTKLGRYMLEEGEGWLFKSDNILTERDPQKLNWTMLPEGQHGIRNPEFGSVQEEHNIIALSDGTLYCMYRTTTGHPCHSYSFDGGHTWTEPEHAAYTPKGRKFKHNRACPMIWRAENGKYLFWFNNFGGKTYQKRNPVWISGGIEKNGRIHWSQPEILLYDPAGTEVRISYPDLIEQNGKYWISETQKEVARVHAIDSTLFEGLWNQGQANTVTKNGLILEEQADEITSSSINMPQLPSLSEGNGFSLEFWAEFDSTEAGQILFDSTDKNEKGIRIHTTDTQSLEIMLNDGSETFRWQSDPQTIKPNQWQHFVFILDGGPNVLSIVADGALCDGGEVRERGWGRLPETLNDANGADKAYLAPRMEGSIQLIRVYNRYLRTSEAISHYHAKF